MDKITKKRRKYYLLIKSSVSTQKTLVRVLYAADDRNHLGSWLDVTVKYRPAGPVPLLQS